MSDAAKCRERGWTVGTRLVGDEGYGPTVIRITAIGEVGIMAVAESHNGVAVPMEHELSWTLAYRDWQLFSPEPDEFDELAAATKHANELGDLLAKREDELAKLRRDCHNCDTSLVVCYDARKLCGMTACCPECDHRAALSDNQEGRDV